MDFFHTEPSRDNHMLGLDVLKGRTVRLGTFEHPRTCWSGRGRSDVASDPRCARVHVQSS